MNSAHTAESDIKESGDIDDKLVAEIYVVDDEPQIAEVICALLELNDYRCKAFTCPKKAFREFVAAGDGRPKLLITDYQMPEINGMELIQLCKAEDSSLRVISASGTLQLEEMRSYPVQPDLYLAKPFYTKDLIAAVNEIFGR